ncbi:PREDICTED: probable F-box protein At4g22060 [Camelina sativa]|uniref:Probable F-box protein At4g22060 n=1 Tax=Camelina sativa TaxID=90675 RepID=A0ABM0UTM7_CAMSA|nr:PREDICTED: probable F-box protein At4g22060 [Camelina sativa]
MFVHHQTKLYILNPLTRERINLPPLESLKSDDSSSQVDLDRLLKKSLSDLMGYTEKAVLWVDERSKDYFVFWSRMPCPIFSKKGDDDFWNMFPYLSTGVIDLVYKGHLLYIYTLMCFIEIYDFSGDSPLPVTSRPYACIPPSCLSSHSYISATRIAVTTSGEVLMVRCCDINSFYVYKMNHATETWDHMASLGDQALIFDLGITVPAKDIQGIKPDSIYFSGPSFGTHHIFIFNLATRKVEPFLSYTSKFFDARWFIPNV